METCKCKPGKVRFIQDYFDVMNGDMFNTSNMWNHPELAVVDNILEDRFGYSTKNGGGYIARENLHNLILYRKNEDGTLDVLVGRNIFPMQSNIMSKSASLESLAELDG